MKIGEVAKAVEKLVGKIHKLEEEDRNELRAATRILLTHVRISGNSNSDVCIPISLEQVEQIALMKKRYETLLDMMGADQEKLEAEIDVQIARNKIVVVPGLLN